MGLLNSRQKCLPNWLIYRDCKFRSKVSTIIKAKQVNQKMFRQLLYRTFSLNMPPLRERERAQLFGIRFKKAPCIYTICASSGFLSTIISLNSRRWCFRDWQASKSCKLHFRLMFLYMLGNWHAKKGHSAEWNLLLILPSQRYFNCTFFIIYSILTAF